MPIVEIACAVVTVRDGRARRKAFSGNVVDVTEAEAERLLSIGAIDLIRLADDGGPVEAGGELPAATSSPESGAPIDRNGMDVPTAVSDRPRSAAAKAIWEAYAASRGIDITGMGKDEIIAAVDALDQQ